MRIVCSRNLLFFLCWFGCFKGYAQSGNLSGQVVDSVGGHAIEYASVSLVDGINHRTITGTVTGTNGMFSLRGLKIGKNSLLIEAIGFLSLNIQVTLSDNVGQKDIGKIRLVQQPTGLQSVTVTGGQRLIENRIDKIVFNAEKDLTSQGGVVTDILKKIPQVSVDVDGNVELAGSSSIRFLIDGKPSASFGSNIADVLQSIPASQIKSIEIITNPGAKYDAQGLGGVINIILKHNLARGINGSVSATAASRNENGSLNLSVRDGNLGVNVFVDGNVRLAATTPLTSERLSRDTASKTQISLAQNGSSRFYRYGLESGISLDYTFKKKNNFTFSLSGDYFGSSNKGSQNQSQRTTDDKGDLITELLSVSQTKSDVKINTTNLSFDYKRTFIREDQELNFGIHSSADHNEFNSTNARFALPGKRPFYETNNANPGTQKETEIVLDYAQPMGTKLRLGVGGKMVFTNINSVSDVLSLQPSSGMYYYDSTLSNYLRYQQQVYALYAELSFPVAGLFDMKIGMRYERTELTPFFSDLQQQVAEPGYNTLVPSVYFSRKLDEKQTLKLNYSKRIERPDYRDLNPFINTTDPYNITTGNPYLEPEIGHRIELGWNYDLSSGGSFMISAFYRINENDIQPYVVYYANLPVGDTTYKNVNVSTRQNIGTEKNLGLNLFSDLHLTPKFNVRTNIFVFHRQGINSLDSGIVVESWNYRINLNLSYKFSTSLAGEFFANFNSPRNEIQGKYPSFSYYTFAFRKQIWKKKGSIALTATNIFTRYLSQQTSLYGSNFTVKSLREVPFRSIGINFTWKFGKLDFKKPVAEKAENSPVSGD